MEAVGSSELPVHFCHIPEDSNLENAQNILTAVS